MFQRLFNLTANGICQFWSWMDLAFEGAEAVTNVEDTSSASLLKSSWSSSVKISHGVEEIYQPAAPFCEITSFIYEANFPPFSAITTISCQIELLCSTRCTINKLHNRLDLPYTNCQRLYIQGHNSVSFACCFSRYSCGSYYCYYI